MGYSLDDLYSMFPGGVYFADTEYATVDGELFNGVCACFHEYRTGAVVTLAVETEGQRPPAPLSFGPDTLFICYSATAELGFFNSMRWRLPYNVLDLWVEYRNLTNGKTDNQGCDLETGILTACHSYGVIDTTSVDEKERMRQRIMAGFPFTPEEMATIVEYCSADVRMLCDLAERLVPDIWDIEQALHRGRCQKAISCMEANGTPVDVDKLALLRKHTRAIRRMVVKNFEAEYHTGGYDFDKQGDPHMVWKNYTAWVHSMGFTEETWPHTSRGFAGADDDDILEPMAIKYTEQFPAIEQFRQLRKFLTLAKSEFKFPVGADGRNRCRMLPFSASTSRSQPKTSENIPNATKALRSLLRPAPGQVLIHRDWSNAEYGIVAALADDDKRWHNYMYRDAYLTKAADFGYCDYDATDETHHDLRNKFKPVVLAGQYMQSAKGLAETLGITVQQAATYQKRELALYPKYKAWLDHFNENIAFDLYADTEFGWRLHTTKRPTGHALRTAVNHPAQGNCAEIMRYAACLMTEQGIDLCCSIHDAFMVVADEDRWEEVDAVLVKCMNDACEAVLGDGYILRSSRDVVHYPDHYSHKDGRKMWSKIEAALEAAQSTCLQVSEV